MRLVSGMPIPGQRRAVIPTLELAPGIVLAKGVHGADGRRLVAAGAKVAE